MSSTITQTKQTPSVSSGKDAAAASPPPPPFTLTSLRESIPKHCFEKNLWTSIYYMLRDFAFIGACYAVYPYINAAGGAYNPYGLTKFLWWNVVGFFGWCLFVVGHDCGETTHGNTGENKRSREETEQARNSVRCSLRNCAAHGPAVITARGGAVGRCADV